MILGGDCIVYILMKRAGEACGCSCGKMERVHWANIGNIYITWGWRLTPEQGMILSLTQEVILGQGAGAVGIPEPLGTG